MDVTTIGFFYFNKSMVDINKHFNFAQILITTNTTSNEKSSL